MLTDFLNSFQLIVAGYLLWSAYKGEGDLFRGADAEGKKKLRISYIVIAIVALLQTGITALRDRMFTLNYTETEIEVTQNFTIDALPFLTYDLLYTVGSVLSFLIIGALGVILFKTREPKRKP